MLNSYKIEIRNRNRKKFASEGSDATFTQFFEAIFRAFKQAHPHVMVKNAIQTDLVKALENLDLDYLEIKYRR